MARVLAGLRREGQIRFDMSPFVARDFLPVELCARPLARIARRRPAASSTSAPASALPSGRLALWLIEGYGRGELIIGSPAEKDSFVLDAHRLAALYGAPCTDEDLRQRCLDLGRKLAAQPGA